MREMAHKGELPGITKSSWWRSGFCALRRYPPDNRSASAGSGRRPGPSTSGGQRRRTPKPSARSACQQLRKSSTERRRSG